MQENDVFSPEIRQQYAGRIQSPLLQTSFVNGISLVALPFILRAENTGAQTS